MNIFSRLSDILSANLHLLLDKAENPEAMMGLMLRDMEDELALTRSQLALAIAAERRLGRELAKQNTAIEHWNRLAREPAAANCENSNRWALVCKKQLELSAAELTTQHQRALETIHLARASLHLLENQAALARAKQHVLLVRYRAAQARQALGRSAGKRLDAKSAPNDKLARWEQRLNEMEDLIAAQWEVQGLVGLDVTKPPRTSDADPS